MRLQDKFKSLEGQHVGVAGLTRGHNQMQRVNDMGDDFRYEGISETGDVLLQGPDGSTQTFKVGDIVVEDDDMIVFKNKGGFNIPTGDDGKADHQNTTKTDNIHEIMISKREGQQYRRHQSLKLSGESGHMNW